MCIYHVSIKSWEKLDGLLAGSSGSEESLRVRQALHSLLEALDGEEPTRAEIDASLAAFKVKRDVKGAAGLSLSTGSDVGRRGYSAGGVPRSPWWNVVWIIPLITVAGVRYAPEIKRALTTEPVQKTYSTSAGQRATFDLPDGSHVILAPQSRLQLTLSRQVSLQGEAYFEVSAHNKAPFTVITPRAITRVLGTAFSVRAIDGEKTEQVVVASGKVSFAGNGANAPAEVLTGATSGQIDTQGHVQVTRGVSTGDLLSWTEGYLVFRNVTAGHMLAELSRWYAVDMRLADKSQAGRLVTATYSTSKSLDSVTQILSYMLGVTAKRSGNTITFIKQE